MAPPEYEKVLSFWFGELDAHGAPTPETSARWFKKDAAFDQAIRDGFATLHAAVHAGEREDWLATTRGRLAYVIVLDQFSRNMFRDTPAMFASDPRALAAALDGIERGADRELGAAERAFFYMPLMHSEDLAVQDRCVAVFGTWRDGLVDDLRKRAESSVDYAEKHRAIVRRFGRFPHRNAILGRPSTPEEVEFLSQPGSSF
jgi:uncharacterized protein (DUF924 family)